MVDKNGRFYGIDKDYIRLLEQKTGLKIKVEPQRWSQAVNRAKTHEIDGLTAAVITDDRKKHLIFSNVYFVSPTAVYIRQEMVR
ncbi:MAG: transporter substrate-binding domain-containing protein [Deltaproteobacteria bacterium]|nr:transporter substrate-binding domain-containing protein [Deltaproteobacteria bacterium]